MSQVNVELLELKHGSVADMDTMICAPESPTHLLVVACWWIYRHPGIKAASPVASMAGRVSMCIWVRLLSFTRRRYTEDLVLKLIQHTWIWKRYACVF